MEVYWGVLLEGTPVRKGGRHDWVGKKSDLQSNGSWILHPSGTGMAFRVVPK